MSNAKKLQPKFLNFHGETQNKIKSKTTQIESTTTESQNSCVKKLKMVIELMITDNLIK